MDMIIFIGLQASGKSTFFRTSFANTYTYVSKDLLRNNKKPGRRQAQLIEEALQAGRSVVVDNTNATLVERHLLIVQGRMHGAKIIGYYFESQVQHCIERNKQRTGKAKVPVVALYATAKKLVPPSLSEGFDELYTVRIGENSTFEIEEGKGV
ncbi:MAG: ATP-binding protein [Chloroflexota bacterium]|nr:ATP-binding protein [Chloroflexota bacterium]